MSSRTANYLPEPQQTWKRKNYPLLSPAMHPEKRAELETNRDLTKSIEQLLCDVPDRAEGIGPGGNLVNQPVQAMLQA